MENQSPRNFSGLLKVKQLANTNTGFWLEFVWIPKVLIFGDLRLGYSFQEFRHGPLMKSFSPVLLVVVVVVTKEWGGGTEGKSRNDFISSEFHKMHLPGDCFDSFTSLFLGKAWASWLTVASYPGSLVHVRDGLWVARPKRPAGKEKLQGEGSRRPLSALNHLFGE